MPRPWAALLLLLRSSAVGILATLVDLGLLTLLVEVFRVMPRIASLPALITGVAIQFIGNKRFAFRDRSSAWLGQAMAFGLVEVLGLTVNYLLFDFVMAHARLPYLPVRMVTTSMVYFGLCLPLWTRIFSSSEAFSVGSTNAPADPCVQPLPVAHSARARLTPGLSSSGLDDEDRGI